mmetsp:Transcript_1592/g.3041  ORF Transcript_1592/g.3041 Transcript_1592/m.3041 type:complete len:259 (-) Transcript_1592:827-1603(-)
MYVSLKTNLIPTLNVNPKCMHPGLKLMIRSIGLSTLLFLFGNFPMLSVGHIAFLYIVRIAHVLPILHIQTNNRLLRHSRIHPILNRPNHRPGIPPKLLRLLRGPRSDSRKSLLDQKAKVKDILDRLREGLWIEETIHRIHLRILLDKLFFLLLDRTLIIIPLGYLGFVLLRLLHGHLAFLPRPFAQCFANDLNMLLHRAQFIPVALLLFPSLIHIFRLFLLFVPAFYLCLLFAAFGHFAYFRGVFCIEGSIEEGHVTG